MPIIHTRAVLAVAAATPTAAPPVSPGTAAATSEGPAVRVWLTDAPVRRDSSGRHVFDDGRYVSLGRLKGNLGNQRYPIPQGTDLTGLTSVSIWCDRFDVSFGAAELGPAA